MHVRRTHGIASGMLLVLLGVWVAAVPYVGPHFHYSVGSTEAWHWTVGRLWLNLVPGAVTFLAGVVLVAAKRRGTLLGASGVAVLAGIWVVIGPEMSRVWHGSMQGGTAAGDIHHQVFEVLGYSLLSGCAIAVIASYTLGRTSVFTMEDVRHDLELRQQDLDAVAGAQTAPSTAALAGADRPGQLPTTASSNTRRRRWPWQRRSSPSQPEVIDLRPPDAALPGSSSSADRDLGVEPRPSPSSTTPTDQREEAAATAAPDPGQPLLSPPPPPPAPR